MKTQKFPIGSLLKLKNIPGSYRARVIGHASDDGLFFENHPKIPYSAKAYELDLADQKTKKLLND